MTSAQPGYDVKDRDERNRDDLSLNDAAGHLLEECRMVLPGIQALFGFQLVAVFNQHFSQTLMPGEQQIHLLSTTLVALAIALVMGPAAWHRQVEPQSVSQKFINVGSRMLLWSMLPLAIGISLEVFLVARVILQSRGGAIVLGTVALCAFLLVWLVLPWYGRTLRRREEK